MILRINPHGQTQNSNISLFDLFANSYSDPTRVPRALTFPQTHREKRKQGRIFPARGPLGRPHRKTHLIIPPQRGKKPTSLGQGSDVRGCRFLTAELNTQHPQKSQLGWMEDGWDSQLSQEISNPCSTADPPGLPPCVTSFQTPLWQVGEAKVVRISRGFPLETEFPRNSLSERKRSVGYLYSWLIRLPRDGFSRGLVTHGPASPFPDLTGYIHSVSTSFGNSQRCFAIFFSILANP